MARLRRKGLVLHHEAHGTGAPVLLTHGFGATCRMWDEQVEDLTNRCRLILWDLPGHGGSVRPRGVDHADRLVGDMAAVLDANDVPRAVLMGLGVGGSLSLRFWKAHPSRVRALVLIGTLPGLRSEVARDLWNGQIEAMASTLERDGLDTLEGGAEVDPAQHASAEGLAAAARMLLPRRDDGALPFLSRIDVPVLILVGSDDRPNLTAGAHMARVIRHAKHVVVPRASHAVNMHRPAAVNAAIRTFLGGLPR